MKVDRLTQSSPVAAFTNHGTRKDWSVNLAVRVEREHDETPLEIYQELSTFLLEGEWITTEDRDREICLAEPVEVEACEPWNLVFPDD